uniref:Uncharacterized protein n=1 Tax=Arundo donax TaxID=35708 RepID=A0A0A9EAN0_ARUDO
MTPACHVGVPRGRAIGAQRTCSCVIGVCRSPAVEDPAGMGHDLPWSVSMLPLVPTMQPAAPALYTLQGVVVGVAT